MANSKTDLRTKEGKKLREELMERAAELRLQGKRYDEIAEELGVAPSTVSAMLWDKFKLGAVTLTREVAKTGARKAKVTKAMIRSQQDEETKRRLSMSKTDISPDWPTVFDLAQQIPYVDLAKPRARGSAPRGAPPVTDGLTPEPFPVTEGYFNATPQQLASLKVPRIEIDGEVRGFQRDKLNVHARNIARSLLEGKEMPPLVISIFPDGNAYIDDGQHRALGAILARKNVEVVVKRRTVEQARELYANQVRARKVSTNDTILTGNSALELYIQDACTNDEHPWAAIVAPTPRKGRISPTAMAVMVGPYSYNSLSAGVNYYTSRPDEDFDILRANQLARLLGVFGTKETNPSAFTGQALRAIASAAVFILRRNPKTKRGDIDRWMTHMGQFDFNQFPHFRHKEQMLTFQLVEHWNKHLSAERRVDPMTLRHH